MLANLIFKVSSIETVKARIHTAIFSKYCAVIQSYHILRIFQKYFENFLLVYPPKSMVPDFFSSLSFLYIEWNQSDLKILNTQKRHSCNKYYGNRIALTRFLLLCFNPPFKPRNLWTPARTNFANFRVKPWYTKLGYLILISSSSLMYTFLILWACWF